MNNREKPSILSKMFESAVALTCIYAGASSIGSSDTLTSREDKKIAIVRSAGKTEYLTGKYSNGLLDSISSQSFSTSSSGELIYLGRTNLIPGTQEFENASLELRLKNKSQRLNF